MAVGKLSGMMLQNNLDRQGVDLSFDGDLLYLDVGARRVGINTDNLSAITDTLTVIGNIRASNTISGNSYYIGNISPVNVADISGPQTIVHIIGTGAVAVPSGNTIQRPSSATPGSLRHLYEVDPISSVVTTTSLEWYNGTEWVVVGSGQNEIISEVIVPDGSNSIYTLTETAAAANSTSDTTLVVINGVVQEPDEAYTILSGNISFAETPASSDRIVIRYLAGGLMPKSYPILVGSLANITNVAPASSSAAGTKGDIRYDSNYLYVCVETNTWIRSSTQNSF